MTRRRDIARAVTAVLWAGVACWSSAAHAETWAAPGARTFRWTIEIVGGGTAGIGTTAGKATATFGAGSPFTAQNGSPSRTVPSWFFGDGAALFGEVRSQFASKFGLPLDGITPLDSILHSTAARQGAGIEFGVRVARRVSSRLALEFSVTRGRASVKLTDAARGAIETSRASFVKAFTSLLTTIPQTGLLVTATAAITEPPGAQTAATGGLTITVAQAGALEVFATAGGGVLINGAKSTDVVLKGNYQFLFLDRYPINETDLVTLHITTPRRTAVGVFGGGVTVGRNGRQGFRVDVRVSVGKNQLATSLDARPASLHGQPSIALPSNTSPSIQFSSTTDTPSSLGGAAISGAQTFGGTGLALQVRVSAGYLIRF